MNHLRSVETCISTIIYYQSQLSRVRRDRRSNEYVKKYLSISGFLKQKDLFLANSLCFRYEVIHWHYFLFDVLLYLIFLGFFNEVLAPHVGGYVSQTKWKLQRKMFAIGCVWYYTLLVWGSGLWQLTRVELTACEWFFFFKLRKMIIIIIIIT